MQIVGWLNCTATSGNPLWNVCPSVATIWRSGDVKCPYSAAYV